MKPPRKAPWRWLALAAIPGLARAALVSRAAAIPASVQMLAVASDAERLSLQVALRLQNIDKLEGMLRAVSEPSSPDYGKYLTAEAVNDYFKPVDGAAEAVKKWLAAAGVTDISGPDQGNNAFINFATTVGTANKLLGATFARYSIDGVGKLRTPQYAIPDELVPHVELVSPTNFFGKTKAVALVMDDYVPTQKREPASGFVARRQNMNATKGCYNLLTPDCTEQMYNYGSYKADPAAGSRVGFASFLNESAIQSDLTLYLKQVGLPQSNFTTVLINGGKDSQDPRTQVGEANLDSQFMASAVKNLPMTQFITGGLPPFIPNLAITNESQNTNEPYLQYYQFLLNQSNSQIPQVISHSYGDDEQTVPRNYAVRVCNMIGMMGLRGISILESSGDTGIGAPCRANDGTNQTQFTPQFPGTCPYVTAVGGTQAYNPEVAWIGSSGGFSNYFPAAWYQKDAVATYLDKGLPSAVRAYYEPFTNFSGRAFPDVAAHSLGPPWLFVLGGAVSYTGGTSAAAPLVAGLIALLNDARLRAKMPTMGFLNPWIYAGGYKGFTDIVAGGSRGCQGSSLQSGQSIPGAGIIPFASWNATAGWDPVTGWGVPNFEEMLKLALQILGH